MAPQLRTQLADAVNGRAVRQYGSGVDLGIVGLSVGGSPSADRVEILQCQSRRINYAMALPAERLIAMLFQSCAHRFRSFALYLRKVRVFDGRGRRRRRRALNSTEHPRATKDWRRAVRIRRSHQDGGLTEQSKTSLIRQLDFSELRPGDALNSV